MCLFFMRVIGWIFLVCFSAYPLVVGAQEQLIVVDFSNATLSLYSGEILMAEFPVVVPYPAEEPRKFPVYGMVKKIEKNPSWYPTGRTRDVFLAKRKIVLPKVVNNLITQSIHSEQ